LNLRKWFFLFFTTLGIGAFVSLVFGLSMERNMWNLGPGNIFFGLLGHIGAGILFSLISQMGFFAYLTIHRFGLGLFRGKGLWSAVQLLLLGFTFFDLIYLRYTAFGQGQSLARFLILPAALLLFSIVIAYFKVKQTNARAWIPSIFFLFVITVVEWLPALKGNNSISLYYMLIPLLSCNTWQLMQLHRLTKQEKAEIKPKVHKKAGL
jgi:KinB signaling pathway activation protein